MTFDFERDLHGMWIVPTKGRLTTASLHGADIDAQVAQLKTDLDAIAERMKAELSKPRKPLFGGENAHRT